ncbi:KLHDC3 [Symbiodinium sp. KB8]|nr:KLHDC3 [Symbiodinium sp. KB8]
MAPYCRPLRWSEPACLDRAGCGARYWWTKPDSFQDRDVYGHSATVVAGRVWVLGGKNQPGKRIAVHTFDPVALVWSDHSPADRSVAPTKRWGHSVCEAPGRMLLVVGGFDSKHNLRDTWAYSTEDGTFAELCDDLQVFGAYHSLAFEQKHVYTFSSSVFLDVHRLGTIPNGQLIFCRLRGKTGKEYSFVRAVYAEIKGRAAEPFSSVHTLQFEEDQEEGWNRIPISGPKPSCRAQHGAIIRGGAMIMYGGANNVQQFNDVWLLDLLHHAWTEIQPARLSVLPPPVETRIEEQHFRVKSCRSIIALRGMQLLVLGRARKPATGRWGLYSFDLHSACWKALPTAQTALWRGNAAGWVTKLPDGTEELWVHGGHMEPGSALTSRSPGRTYPFVQRAPFNFRAGCVSCQSHQCQQ